MDEGIGYEIVYPRSVRMRKEEFPLHYKSRERHITSMSNLRRWSDK